MNDGLRIESEGRRQGMMNRTEMKRHLITILKVAAACVLIGYLFKSGRLRTENLLRLIDSKSTPFLILSAFAFLSSQMLSSIRMMFLLNVIELRMSLILIFKLTMIGNFFNIVIPGTIGGDLVKGYYLALNEGTSKGRSSGIVIIDRVLGLIALSLIGFVSTIYMVHRYSRVLLPYQYELIGIITLSFVTLASFLGLILISTRKQIREKMRKIILKAFPQGFFYHVIEGFALITKKRRYILYAFLMSIVVQGISLAGLLNLVNFIGENTPDVIALVAVSSTVMLMGVFPLTPGNIGWTELLATFGWSALGAKGGADIFLSWRIITVVCSLLGGFFYLIPLRSLRNHQKEARPRGPSESSQGKIL